MVTLATAHPAKFPEAVMQAGHASEPALPSHMADLFEREERYSVLANDSDAVHGFMAEKIAR
jgi:threonine synthase